MWDARPEWRLTGLRWLSGSAGSADTEGASGALRKRFGQCRAALLRSGGSGPKDGVQGCGWHLLIPLPLSNSGLPLPCGRRPAGLPSFD